MSLTQKTKLLLHILESLPNSRDICDVKIEGRGEGILFSWSYASEGIPKARFKAEDHRLYVQIFEVADDIAQKTALAFFVQQTINMQSESADQVAMHQVAVSEAWPGDLINAASLARAMRADIETRLRNNETIDMLVVLKRLITLFEEFEL